MASRVSDDSISSVWGPECQALTGNHGLSTVIPNMKWKVHSQKIHMVKENILLFKNGDESWEEYIPTSKESAETGE